MIQAWQLLAAALCATVVAAVEDAAYIEVADFSTDAPTDSIVSMRTVISVALNDDSVPEIDHDDHVSWTHGQTKLDITIEWTADSGDTWKDALAGVSTLACTNADVTASQNVYPGSGAAQQWQWPLNQPSEETTGTSGGTQVTYSLVENLVISMDKAPCAYVVLDSVPQATVTVVPSPPVFPETFYAGIESTHVTEGYSRYGSEAYSHTCDAVSFAFYNSDVGFKRVIGDYKNQNVWHVTSPNATFPNGVCWKETMSNRPEFIEGENGGLVSSSKFLGFVNSADGEATYVPNGGQKIRGIPVDQWDYKTLRSGAGDTVERLTVHLYFSSPEWHFAKSSGHRILQRVEVTGHSDDAAANTSTHVDNSYDYIDFRPFLPPWSGFEPCEIMPGGEGCECLSLGCTDQSSAERGVVTSFASPASCEALGASSGARTDRQKRDLMLVWFFGVLVGTILAGIGAFLARKYLHMRMGQNAKETEITAQQQPGAVFTGAFAPSSGQPSDGYMEQQ